MLDVSALPTSDKDAGQSKAFPSSSTSKPAAGSDPANGQAMAVTTAAKSPCEEPAKLFSARDYSGPGKRFAAWFTRKPEMTTVPKNKGGQPICGLDAGQKFHLFFKTTVDPVTFVGAAASAGWSQYQNYDEEWGQGAEGYGYRYAAAYGDRVISNFFGKFFYPTLFHEDPRYFRKGTGGFGGRLGHAIDHSFVARTDSGGHFANVSNWAAIASSVAIANLYHPGHSRGFTPAAERFGTRFGTSMGFDVLKEFWPETVRALKLPFRERKNVPATD
ncbi:MAG TPA: hypothetical protein VE783_04135, partial [Candidatus Limnocylindrales bacterium]|nr:hypothetical protein [Candidatus Limnocylindrales bacterium]